MNKEQNYSDLAVNLPLTSISKESRIHLLSGMSAEVFVAYQDISSQQLAEQVTPIPRITPQEFRDRFGFAPLIPGTIVLHREYERQKNVEIEEGRYVPGELLPVNLNQQFLRNVFINLGRKNIHEDTPIDWYNPTQPFDDGGDMIMAVRFEPHDSELSFVGFIKENPETGNYEFDSTRPIIDMAQDPSVTLDDKGNLILGVVKIHANKDGKITHYKTLQFRGHDVRNMKVFQTLSGKDNRPVQLPDRVRAFYRPQGKIGGPGKLAFRDYPNWESYKNDTHPLTKEDLHKTNFQFHNHGGPNFPLLDGQVYGHIAEKEYDENGEVIKLHYYVTWMLTDQETGQLVYREDPETGDIKPLFKVVAERSDFPTSEDTPDKDLENPQRIHNVVFTGGVKKLPNGRVRITTGISDTRIGVKEIDDPMLDVNVSDLRLVA